MPTIDSFAISSSTNNVLNVRSLFLFDFSSAPFAFKTWSVGHENVISVTALGTNDRWNHWATYHETVDLGSPGESIMSSTNQNGTSTNAYSSWSGTSMASPVAASCIGLLSAYNPSWGNKQLETMIIATATASC